MRTTGHVLSALTLFSLALAGGAYAQEAPHVPLAKTIGQPTATAPVPSLAVMNAAGATLADGVLTLTGVSANTIVFADRPVRAAGHVTTAQFILQWDEGKDNFAVDPPNATVSVLGGEGGDVSDAVVTLSKPRLEGGNLSFDVTVLEGALAGAAGPAAVFIDHFAGGYHGGVHINNSVHINNFNGGNYWHAPNYHGAWYGAGAFAAGAVAGAALSSAAAAPPYPPCGYYPYPACY